MKDELFAELMESAEEALDHARGKRELRTTVLPLPPEPMAAAEVKQLRSRLNASQAVFAHYLNVSTKLVQAWEAAALARWGRAQVAAGRREESIGDIQRSCHKRAICNTQASVNATKARAGQKAFR